MTDNCTHHWIINTTHGKASLGTCKHCLEIKWFDNYIDTNDWHDRYNPSGGVVPNQEILRIAKKQQDGNC